MEKKLFYSHTASLFRDWYAQLISGLTLFLNVWIWIMLFIRVKPGTELVTLHYNIYFGITLVGEWYKIFVIPLFGISVFVINFFFSSMLYRKDKVGAYLVACVGLVVQAILLFSAHLVTSFTVV